MRIVADEAIPQLELFARWGELIRLPGREISNKHLQRADALLVRSITPVDANLLTGSRLRFVGSTTSGIDHIDQAYLHDAGIAFAHAPGCNAEAVADYVCSALAALGADLGTPAGRRVGVLGFGQVGSRVAGRLHKLGFEIKAYDPLLKSSDNAFLGSLDEALQCDLLTLHVPLTDDGAYPTRHMLNAGQLDALPRKLVLINAARGAVIDNRALAAILPSRPHWQTVLDVWEGEPLPDQTLLQRVSVATPHIAGYSLQAKNRGSAMVYQAFLRHFDGLQSGVQQGMPHAVQAPLLQLTANSRVDDVVLSAYDVRDDMQGLRTLLGSAAFGKEFERLRKSYRVRHEFSVCRFNIEDNVDIDLINKLKHMSFNA